MIAVECPVDPFLQSAMGTRYGREQQGTDNAGYIGGDLMRYFGYAKDGGGALPADCVARTAAICGPRKSLR